MGNMQNVVRRLVSTVGSDCSTVAYRINSTPQNIYKWMGGKSIPDGEHLFALIKLAYQCDKDEVEKIVKGF